jgi:hypothetical protein
VILTIAEASTKLCLFMRQEMAACLNGKPYCATTACMAWDWIVEPGEKEIHKNSVDLYIRTLGWEVVGPSPTRGEYMVIMRLTEAKAKGRCGFAMGEVTVEQQ